MTPLLGLPARPSRLSPSFPIGLGVCDMNLMGTVLILTAAADGFLCSTLSPYRARELPGQGQAGIIDYSQPSALHLKPTET